MAYDLLLKGGTVIDPSQGIHRRMDVALKDGKIAALRDRIEEEAEEAINVSDKLVVPGLIDLHTHVYWGGTSLGVHADELSVRSGVTTFVDAGSAGAGNFAGFKEHVIETSRARIFAFLNIGFAGIFGFMGARPDGRATLVGELCDIRLANVGEAVRIGRAYPRHIVGIKVRAGIDGSCDFPGVEPIFTARRAAEELGKPLMAHIGLPPPTTDTMLPILRSGDILTHAFRGDPNSVLDGKGRPLPELVEARERGVIIDLGHGSGSFSFETARKMLDQGFLPDVISTDVHVLSINGPAYDLPTTMSKMLNLGMRLDDVIRACTHNPAKVIGYEDELGTLREGTAGDITVLELAEGAFEFRDAFRNKMLGRKKLRPTLTILKGKVLGQAGS